MIARGHHVHVTSSDIPDQIANKVRSLGAHPNPVATSANSRVLFQNPDDFADFIAAGCLSDSKKARLVNGSGVDLTRFRVSPMPEGPAFPLIARLLKTKQIQEYVDAAK
jgi:hypothetical protein